MTDVRFYHLTRQALEDVLPGLLEKTLAQGKRAVVMTGSDERAEALTSLLWTYRPDGFLPHGNAKDGHAADQPIWITAKDERPNDATFLFLTDGASSDNLGAFERVCDLFDGLNDEAKAAARARWKIAEQAGHQVTYWQQTDSGWTDATPKK